MKFEWQQVPSSLQDSSQDSGRSQQCCRLDSLYSTKSQAENNNNNGNNMGL